ncbi:MAG: hypothetical protein ACYTG4_09105 [Planctomycetota bacterium]
MSDPMDDNYKLSRKFELGVLQKKVVALMNKHYQCKKIDLPAEADMKKLKNQARIETWAVTGKNMGTISSRNSNVLNKAPFMAFLKARVAKNKSLVKKEVKRIEKLRAKRAKALEKAKKETAAK